MSETWRYDEDGDNPRFAEGIPPERFRKLTRDYCEEFRSSDRTREDARNVYVYLGATPWMLEIFDAEWPEVEGVAV